MSRETMEDLNRYNLIGFTAERGHFWHWREDLQGDEPNHYDGAIPVADVIRRLFYWDAISSPVLAQIPVDPTVEPSGFITIEDASRQAIVRPDTQTILGLFSEGYKIHQYKEWLIDNVTLLMDDDLQIGSAGLLDKGGMAYVQIEMPKNIEIPEVGEAFRPYFLATTSLNGKLSTTFKRVYTRVGCDNTCEYALGEKSATSKIKHTKYSKFDVNAEREKHSLMEAMTEDIIADVLAKTKREVTGKQFISWLDAFAPVPEDEGRAKTMAERKREELLTLWMHDERVAPWAGTEWGVQQLANTHAQHFASVNKGTSRVERNVLGAATGKLFDADNTALALLNQVLQAA